MRDIEDIAKKQNTKPHILKNATRDLLEFYKTNKNEEKLKTLFLRYFQRLSRSYKLQFKTSGAANSHVNKRYDDATFGTASTFTVMEIAG